MGNKQLTADLTKRAIRRAEYEFTEVIKIDADNYLITGVPFYNYDDENKCKKSLEDTLEI